MVSNESKIQLTVTPDYLSGWSVWHAIRELVANAVDSHHRAFVDGPSESAGSMAVSWRDGKLTVRSHGVKVARESLLLGSSGSRGRDECIGRFGEGLPMALLVLTRSGKAVRVVNGDEVWLPKFERSSVLDSEVLAVYFEPTDQAHEFRVEVECDEEDWEIARTRFLHLHPSLNANKILPLAAPDSGRDRNDLDDWSKEALLLQPDMKGKLFVRGVWVCDREDLPWGFNLDMELNRDRELVEEWMLRYRLSTLVGSSLRNPETRNHVLPKLLDMLKSGEGMFGQAENLQYAKDIVDGVVQWFEETYGKSVPVANEADKLRAEELGLPAVQISPALVKLVELTQGAFVLRLATARAQVRKVFDSVADGLTEQQVEWFQMALTKCLLAMPTLDREWADTSREFWHSRVQIVDFADDSVLWSHKIEPMRVEFIARSAMTSQAHTLARVAQAVARIALVEAVDLLAEVAASSMV